MRDKLIGLGFTFAELSVLLVTCRLTAYKKMTIIYSSMFNKNVYKSFQIMNIRILILS
jgi:hypothetical protein